MYARHAEQALLAAARLGAGDTVDVTITTVSPGSYNAATGVNTPVETTTSARGIWQRVESMYRPEDVGTYQIERAMLIIGTRDIRAGDRVTVGSATYRVVGPTRPNQYGSSVVSTTVALQVA